MQSWRTTSKRTLLDHSPFLRVEEHVVELPDGRVIDNWPWIITPDYINVVAITTGSEFIFLRQTKYAVTGSTLAPVGGYLDPEEDPLDAARRELLEETGYEAPEWINLGQYVVDGNRGSGRGNLFLARGAVRVTEPHADDLEEQEIILMNRAQVEEALDEGQFKVLAWAANVALALRVVER